MAPVRAVYEHGHLRPLQPLDLQEGEEVGILLVTEDDPVRRALESILVRPEPAFDDDEFDEDELQAELDALLANAPLLADVIIEERRSGPYCD